MNSSLRSIAVIAIAFVIFVAFFVGKFNLYAVIPHLDKGFHLIGGAIAAWFFLNYFKHDFKDSRFRYFVAIISAVALVGVVWEFVEYLSGAYGTPAMRYYLYGGSIVDTLGDLVADLIGGALVALGAKQKSA